MSQYLFLLNNDNKQLIMYCIECGKLIPENSKFCQHCGESQEKIMTPIQSNLDNMNIDNNFVNQREDEKHIKVNQKMGFYLIWILIHLTFLLIFSNGIFDNDNSNNGISDFWPFNRNARLRNYDITEFLVYTIFPLIFFLIINLTKKKKRTK